MPTWLKIHGVLLMSWIIIWGFLYYSRLWRLSFPFGRYTSLKIVAFYIVPFCWLISSLIIGIILSLNDSLALLDLLLLLILPIFFTLSMIINIWFNSSKHFKEEEHLKMSISKFKEACQNWLKQFPFVNEGRYELQVFISKNKPVGRIIIYELTCSEQLTLKGRTKELPSGVTVLFSKK